MFRNLLFQSVEEGDEKLVLDRAWYVGGVHYSCYIVLYNIFGLGN